MMQPTLQQQSQRPPAPPPQTHADTAALTPQPSGRLWQWLWLIPVLLILFWLGARHLITDAIWLDEFYSFEESGLPHYGGPYNLIELWGRTATISNWPPGHNTILSTWFGFVGPSTVAGRALSLWFGLLSVAMLYRLGLELARDQARPRLIAGSAALLMGFSAIYIHYYHDMRVYTIFVFLVCLTLWLYWRAINGRAGRRMRIGVALALAGVLYTHPTGQLLFGILGVYHVLFAPRAHRWRVTFQMMVAAALLYLPWVGVMLLRIVQEILELRGLDPIGILQAALYSYSNGLPLILVALAALTLTHIRQRAVAFLWYLVVTFVIAVLVTNVWASFLFHIRLIMLLLPLAGLLAGFGLAQIARTRLRWVIAVPLAAWIALGSYYSLTPEFIESTPRHIPAIPWPSFAETLTTLTTNADPADAVLFQLAEPLHAKPNEYVIKHYTYGFDLHFAQFALLDWDIPYYNPFGSLEAFVGTAPRIWTAFAPQFALAGRTDPLAVDLTVLLASAYTHCPRVIERADLQLDLYVRTGAAVCTEILPPPAQTALFAAP
ncbi:MAG: hypothetical protein GYB67_12240 [Chloroflexi bacterium]|nr:hypothetical protein [Chloroflexota bacterium]